MNMKRTVGILATGSTAIALIGAGVGATFTDHWGATQSATVTISPPPPVLAHLTITSNSQGAVVDQIAKTVTFAPYAITTAASDPFMGGAYDQFGITSDGTGTFQVTAAITSTMPAAELAKFTLNNAGVVSPLSATPVVIASQTGPGTMYLGLQVDWAGLTAAASGYSLAVTYSIDAA